MNKLELAKYKIASHITSDQCRVELIITEQCSFRCSYCYWKDDPLFNFSAKNTISTENFVRVLDFIKVQDKEKNELTFYGGEPTVHPNLIEFIEKAHVAIPGITIYVLSNLSKPIEYFESFPKKPIVKEVIASMHTEFVKDVDAWFDKVKVIGAGEVRLVLTEHNHDIIMDAYKKYKPIYKEQIVIHPLSDYKDINGLMAIEGLDVQIDDDNYSHGDTVEIFYKNGKRFHGNYHNIVDFKGMLCNAGYHVDMKGNVYSCWSAYGAKNIITNLFRDEPKKLSGWTLCTYDVCSCGKRYTKYCPQTYLKLKKENML